MFAGGINPGDLAEQIGEAVDVVGPAGSISIHHVRTLHASRNNMTRSTRPLMLFSYMAVDAFPILESYDIDEFDSRILQTHHRGAHGSAAVQDCPAENSRGRFHIRRPGIHDPLISAGASVQA